MINRIVNLGDIVRIDIKKTISALVDFIADRTPSGNKIEIRYLLTRKVSDVLYANSKLIDDLKLGSISEDEFDEKMIDAIKSATGIKNITIDEFNTIWNAKDPLYADFSPSLNKLIEFNDQANNKVTLISFTNPKDMRHLVKQLDLNSVKYKLENDELIEIEGMKLLTTYTLKKSKAELIELAINNTKKHLSALSNNSAFNRTQSNMQDIKYIRCVNNIADPVLKLGVDQTNQEVDKKASEMLVDTIIWMRDEQTLTSVLNNNKNDARKIPTASL